MTYHPIKAYFSRHSVLRTADLDEARASVSRKFCDHRLNLVNRGATLDVVHNAVRGRNMSVNYLAYGTDVLVSPGYLAEFYLFQLPLTGRARIEHRGDAMTARAGTGTMLNPDRTARLQWDGTCRQLLFQIDRAHLDSVARAFTGAPLPGPIRFDTAVDFSTPPGQQIRRSFMACALGVESGAIFSNPPTSIDTQIEFDLAMTLLLHQPSNISHIVARADSTPKPRDIRRAVDYMHANLGADVTVCDIAQTAKVNVRTLQKGFRQTFGVTPMQALRNARLDMAHYMLQARQDTPSISDTAYSSGFSHLGRFSSYYRARFGHPPSETRKAGTAGHDLRPEKGPDCAAPRFI